MLTGKKGIIFGIANDHSIAWGIGKKLKESGAILGITYQNDSLLNRVQPLAKELKSELLIKCDFSNDTDLDKCFHAISDKWNSIDFIIHAVAYSNKTELNGRYIKTSKENFINTLNISCYSFTEACRLVEPIMNKGGSILTLTYYGAEQVMPHYNVMGIAKAALEASVRYLAVDLGEKNIRVNAISAGPIKTLAASGIGDFRFILKWNELNSPLKRNVSQDEVGNSALYLLSNLGSAVTGEVQHVDCGYHTVGMVAVDEAQEVSKLLNEFNKEK